MNRTLGNHYSMFPHNVSGAAGIGKRGSAFGRVRASGKAGQTIRLAAPDISTNVCQYQAILAQAFGGAAKIAVTLEDPDVALDPANDAAIWSADENITPGTILKVAGAPTATAFRITFVADGYVIVALT